MAAAIDIIAATLSEVDRLRKSLKKGQARQVSAQDERALIKAVALAWINKHRTSLAESVQEDFLQAVDLTYQSMLEASDRATARTTYDVLLKSLREELIALRREGILSVRASTPNKDDPPEFSLLTSDPHMQEILEERWAECVRCISANAPLSATVMMGGLLETLLLGRINREKDKTQIFTSSSVPKDRLGKSKPLGDWMLKDYISVAHELKWITLSARDVAEVLRDFRNYIHPHKQLSHNVRLTADDAALFWEVSKKISLQVLKSC
jgi:hypothetical protein